MPPGGRDNLPPRPEEVCLSGLLSSTAWRAVSTTQEVALVPQPFLSLEGLFFLQHVPVSVSVFGTISNLYSHIPVESSPALADKEAYRWVLALPHRPVQSFLLLPPGMKMNLCELSAQWQRYPAHLLRELRLTQRWWHYGLPSCLEAASEHLGGNCQVSSLRSS